MLSRARQSFSHALAVVFLVAAVALIICVITGVIAPTEQR